MNLRYILFLTYKSLPIPKASSVKKYLNFDNFSVVAGTALLIGGIYFINTQVGGLFGRDVAGAISSSEFISASSPAVEVPKKIEGKPVSLQLNSVGIDLQVVDGYYDQQTTQWTLSLDKAQFGVMTALANNQSGNTYIYGHNRKGVFMTLPNVKVGDKAIVKTENGKIFTYKYSRVITTTPDDTSILSYTGSPILSLQTCTGFGYRDRSMFIFDFVSVEG